MTDIKVLFVACFIVFPIHSLIYGDESYNPPVDLRHLSNNRVVDDFEKYSTSAFGNGRLINTTSQDVQLSYCVCKGDWLDIRNKSEERFTLIIKPDQIVRLVNYRAYFFKIEPFDTEFLLEVPSRGSNNQ